MADIQKDFEAWLDQDWPLWRQAKDTSLIHKLRRTYEAAYLGGVNDDRECLRRAKCGCTGIPAELVTPLGESTLGLTKAEEEAILDMPFQPAKA